MKLKAKRKWIVFSSSIIIILILLSFLVCNIIIKVAGASVPKSQVLSKEDDICIAFSSSSGTGEHLCMYTYKCSSITENQNPHNEIYNNERYLDLTSTIECPTFNFKDGDNNSIKEIYIKQDWLCKWFAHDDNEPIEQFFEVDQNGKFLGNDVYGECS